MTREIRVFGARKHNLKIAELAIPLHSLVTVIGPSGSGKSSLLFDTIVSEAKKRAHRIESSSDVSSDQGGADSISGLPLVVPFSATSRVLSRRIALDLCGLESLLISLYSQLGTQLCRSCANAVKQDSVREVIAELTLLSPETRVVITAPCKADAETWGALQTEKLSKGFTRVLYAGELQALDELSEAEGEVEIAIDLIRNPAKAGARLSEAMKLASQESTAGRVSCYISQGEKWTQIASASFQRKCRKCGAPFPALHEVSFRARIADALAVTLLERAYGELIQLSFADFQTWLAELEGQFEACCKSARTEPFMAKQLHRALTTLKLGMETLQSLDVTYLQLARPAKTLSTGEIQRLRLASALNAGVSGLAYVLDEPTAGLHPRNAEHLLQSLRSLVDRGGSVLMSDANEMITAYGDWTIALGPEAGAKGGIVTYAGNSQPPRAIEVPKLTSRKGADVIVLKDVRRNNLQIAAVEIPKGNLTALCGVSGSGKSTLVFDCLGRSLRRLVKTRGKGSLESFGVGELKGWQGIAKIISCPRLQERPLPVASVASAIGIRGPLRELFASTVEARINGFDERFFRLDKPGARCEACRGSGQSSFFGERECRVCDGGRYNPQYDHIQFKSQTLRAVERMTVDEAAVFFTAVPRIREGCERCSRLGLGYLVLGQPLRSLSNGELRRASLVGHLRRIRRVDFGMALILFDEPSRGLSRREVIALYELFQSLCELGHTVLVTEHNPIALALVDHIIELGPGSGDNGGRIVAMGDFTALRKNESSLMGSFLKDC